MLKTIHYAIAIFLLAVVFSNNSYAQDTDPPRTGVDIIITQSPKIIISLQGTVDNTCFGEEKGAINISAEGGYPPYKYYWSHGSTTQDVAGLKAGEYRVAVYDGFSCSDTLTVSINQPLELVGKIEGIKDILCFGYNQGEIDISVEGGEKPYRFSWSNGATTEDLKGVISGEYSVLITDNNNCQEIITGVIDETPLIVRSVDDVVNILCSGDLTGEIDISVGGGSPPYSYSWSNGATTQDISNLGAGDYEVMVTDSRGCSEVSTAKVEEPNVLALSFDKVSNVRCFGDNGGAVNVRVDGGVQPFTYEWSNGYSTQDIAGVQAGSYELKVTDKNGCSEVIQTEITQPVNLEAKLVRSEDVTFYGGTNGTIDIDVSGGVPPYKYKWNNEATIQDVKDLKSGNYNVKISDATGCSKILNITINQPALLSAKIDRTTDIKCNGNESGDVSITVNGGVKPYVFLWSNGETTEDIANLKAGKYSVLITDANNHKVNVDTTLIEPPKFVAIVNQLTHILCYGDEKGNVDIEVTGGVAPYKYHWSNGEISQDIEDVVAGEYSVKIIDANRCEQQIDVVITQPEDINLNFEQVSNIACFDNSTGLINIAVSGGVAPYTFQWNNGSTSQNLSTIKAGDYEVTVTDKNGCSKIINTKVTQPELLIVREGKVDNIDCFGNDTGQINLTVSGGVTPYQYIWSNGDSTLNVNALTAGKYSVNITDANGCKISYSKTLTSPPKLISTLDGTLDNLCFGDAFGEINMTVKGGVTPYRYRWNTGATSQDLVDIKSGEYVVEIKDANGCLDSLNAVVNEAPLMVSELEVTNILCNGQSTGAVDLSVTGGVAPYKYTWSNGAITQDISKLKTGQYSVVITDANGCSDIKDVLISQPTRFIAILESEKHIRCYGQSTGAINVRVSGGVAPYSYQWSNEATSKNLADIPAGDYKLTVTDSNGCSEIINSTIKQPTEVQYTVNKVTNLNCNGDNGGAVDISITGGVGPYVYNWSNGETTQDLVEVPAGNYSVQITEGNGCKNILEANITQPTTLALKLDTVVHVLCNGDNTGLVNVSADGGVAPYKYSWSNGAITQDISNLIAGKYTLTVTDANGCIKTASTSVKQPRPFVASLLSIENIKCYGDATGKVNLNVTGGIKPYTFAWNNGEKTQNLQSLVAGNYAVTITDANGCIQRLTTVVTQPDLLKSAMVSSSDVSCAGGSDGDINITVTGGTTPYSYSWSNGARTQDLNDVPAGTYSVAIKDVNGCMDSTITVTLVEPLKLVAKFDNVTHILTYGLNTGAVDLAVEGGVPPYRYSWSNGSTKQDIIGVQAGNYSVHVRDSKNCEVILNETVKQPPALNVSIASVIDILCSGESSGAIDVTISGGVKPYTFEWNHGDSIQSIANVPAGDYALTVIDANGHRKVVTSKISEPIPINIKIDNIDHVLCNGAKTGSISATITGGVAPYNYLWSNGATSQDLKNIDAGTYDLIVTDKNGCRKTAQLQVDQPDLLTANLVDVENVKCNGDSEGGIRIEVTGGVTPYRYSWSNGEKTQNLTSVIAGVYSVKISDANGCLQTLDAIISEPPLLNASIAEVINNKCFGQQIGAVSLTVSGGYGAYAYHWNTGDSTKNISNLVAGEYDVIIKDSLGCEQSLASVVTQPDELATAIASITNIKCFGDSQGAVEVDVTGGSAPYNFQWSNGSQEQNLDQIVAGDYKLDIRDNQGCVISIDAKVTEPALLVLALDTVQHNLCKDDVKGLVDITVSGGVTPYHYTWSNGEHAEDLVNVIADQYTVIVKDANECSQNLETEVREPALLVAVIDSVSNIKCYGDKTGEIIISTTGGVAPYQYQWNSGETTPYLREVLAGNYDAMITDANGCYTSIKGEIEQPTALVNTIDAITDIQCYGDSTGSIYVTALEGVEPYSFEWNSGETTADIQNIVAGSYNLKITQGNDCVSYLEAVVEQPALFDATLASVKDVSCFGDETGAVDIDVIGGVTPYDFAWSNGESSQNISEAKADNYSVMVTDANGCLNTINATINEPPKLAMKIDSVRNVKCCGDNSGAIFISVSGGVGPYEYLWSNGATSQDLENLILGRYTVNITDATGCTITALEGEQLNLYEQVVTTGKFITRGIEFDIGKTTIKPESFRIVNKIATLMKEHPDLAFRIDGHTDSDGTADSNQYLSEARSESIKTALIKFGIAESRLYTKGWGESRPISPNTTREGKAKNRRVEFISLTGTLTGEMVENEVLNEDATNED